MGFLDNVKDALRDAVSAQASKKDDVAVDKADSTPTTAPTPRSGRARKRREPKFETYTVKTGDTLSEIGARFGVSPLEIATAEQHREPGPDLPGSGVPDPEETRRFHRMRLRPHGRPGARRRGGADARRCPTAP